MTAFFTYVSAYITEMVAAIREIRSMMGDEMPDEANKRVEIVYTRIKDGEKSPDHEDI